MSLGSRVHQGAMVRRTPVVQHSSCAPRRTRLNHATEMQRQRSAAPKPAGIVYVVDDDTTIQRALERLLRSAGHAVETFGSAEAFLARAELPARGTLLLDVRMPGMSGPELQAHLLDQGYDPRIFFISSVDDEHVKDAALSAGALGWFSKPLDGAALLAAIGAAASADE